MSAALGGSPGRGRGRRQAAPAAPAALSLRLAPGAARSSPAPLPALRRRAPLPALGPANPQRARAPRPRSLRAPSAAPHRGPPPPGGRRSGASAPAGPPRQNKGMWGGGEDARRPPCGSGPSAAQGAPGSRPWAPTRRPHLPAPCLLPPRARRREGRAPGGRDRKVALRVPRQARGSLPKLQSRSGSHTGGPGAILACWKAAAIIGGNIICSRDECL